MTRIAILLVLIAAGCGRQVSVNYVAFPELSITTKSNAVTHQIEIGFGDDGRVYWQRGILLKGEQP